MAFNPFEQLALVVPEPRQAFEDNVALILRALVPGSRRVRVHKGDGGVDVYSGTMGDDGQVDVNQIKYILSPWGDSQKQQVRESYETARTSSDYRLAVWTLCVPTRLTKEDLRWFDQWRAKQDDHEIRLMDGDDLTAAIQLPACAAARDQLKSWGVRGLGQSGVRFVPQAFVTKRGRPQGIPFVIGVQLRIEGDRSARGLRVMLKHDETGCAASAPNDRLWLHEQNGNLLLVNPWTLSCRRDLHPEETVVILGIPCVETTTLPFGVLLQIWAEDYVHTKHRVTISRAHVEAPEVIIPFVADAGG